jgi:hypothetical protein
MDLLDELGGARNSRREARLGHRSDLDCLSGRDITAVAQDAGSWRDARENDRCDTQPD